jgi:hypothetical protein
MTTTALATTGTQAIEASDPYAPKGFEDAWRYAKIIVASKLAPALTSPEQAFLVLATGHELGLTAMQSIRSIHIVEGRPCLSADLIVALALNSGKAEYFTELEATDKGATWETKRKGSSAVRTSFSIEDAKRAGLAGRTTWQKYPAVMLSHRAAAMLARKVYPDVVIGLYDPDELVEPIRSAPRQEHTAPRKVAAVVEVQEAEFVEEPSGPGIASTAPDFERMIADAESLEQLEDVAKSIAASVTKTDPKRIALLKAYAARKKALTEELPPSDVNGFVEGAA